MTASARAAWPIALAALAAVWLGLRQRDGEVATRAEEAVHLFVSPDGPDPSPELIRELATAARRPAVRIRVHVIEYDPARPLAVIRGGRPAEWSRYTRLLDLLAPLVGSDGIAPADPIGARLAASFGITALPALVYVDAGGTIHVREGAAPGIEPLLRCAGPR